MTYTTYTTPGVSYHPRFAALVEGRAYRELTFLFLMVGGASFSTHISLQYGVEIMKPVVLALHFGAVLFALRLIYRSRRNVLWDRAYALLTVLCFFPTLRIAVDTFVQFNSSAVVDGLILKGMYYLLPIIALAVVVTSVNAPGQLTRAIQTYALIASPVVAWLLVTGLGGFGFGSVYSSFDNLLIPLAFLGFLSRARFNLALGLAAIALIIVASALVGSRSYNLLGFCLVVALGLHHIRRHLALALLGAAVVIVTYALLAPIFMQAFSAAAVFEKYRFDSLLDAINQFWATGDFWKLYYWEGNSRSRVLDDAFYGATELDLWFGRGVFATYDSFVTRSTIEIGWAQEVFWFGLSYVGLVVATIVLTIKRGIGYSWTRFGLLSLVAPLATIRLIDGFVYGIPAYHLYNLISFAVILTGALTRRALGRLASPY